MTAIAALTALTVVSGGLSVVSSLRSAGAASAAAGYNAAVAEQNATVARDQAVAEAAQVDRANRLRLGAARAAAGASGVTGVGSALDVIGDLVAQGELERQNALYQGELSARGFSNTAALERRRGKEAGTAGFLQAGSALLGTAGSVIRLRNSRVTTNG